MNNERENEEKKKKAGNPFLVLFVFSALIAFIFYIPDVYKKYNTQWAEFLGVGNKPVESTTQSEDNIEPASDFYQIGSKPGIKFNEITFSNIALDDNILKLDFVAPNSVNFNETNYYIDFYEARSKFVGRRSITGIKGINGTIKLDVSSLNIDDTYYIQLSHITDDSIPKMDLSTDESGLGSISCKKGEYSYLYDFSNDLLIKTTVKFAHLISSTEDYSDELLNYQKKSNSYNEYNGVTATTSQNDNTFIFMSEFDYTNISAFNGLNENYIFSQNVRDNVIKFKMEAEGFECE